MDESRRAEQGSYTLSEWCDRHKISLSMYYKMAKQGCAPQTYNVGTRRLISASADREWIRAREAETKTTAA